MDFSHIIYEQNGPISSITLNRPDKLNVIDFPGDNGIFDEFVAALDIAANNDDVKVVIIKGAGRAFCAGHDLSRIYKVYEEQDEAPGERRPSQRARLKIDQKWLEGHHKLMLLPKLTIAQVHGHCIGEGSIIAEMSDITIVSDDAKISHAEQRLGFSGSGINLIPLYQTVGYKKARLMLLTGDVISGVEAERIGWASMSVPFDQLEETVNAMAKRLSLLPRDGIAIGKANNMWVCDILGFTQGLTNGIVSHTLFTNLRWEKDEYNFVRERAKKGVNTGIHERDNRYE